MTLWVRYAQDLEYKDIAMLSVYHALVKGSRDWLIFKSGYKMGGGANQDYLDLYLFMGNFPKITRDC